MILRAFFFHVFSPSLFVNKKRELKDKRTKKIAAAILWIAPDTAEGNAKVPTIGRTELVHGHKHISKPQIPAKVKMISSNFV